MFLLDLGQDVPDLVKTTFNMDEINIPNTI